MLQLVKLPDDRIHPQSNKFAMGLESAISYFDLLLIGWLINMFAPFVNVCTSYSPSMRAVLQAMEQGSPLLSYAPSKNHAGHKSKGEKLVL